MIKQEQIEEIAKYVCNVCDFKCDWFQSGMKEDSICTTAQETAKAIYNAVSNEIDDMKAENKQLKKENAFLLKACEEQYTFDTTENKKYSIFNSVRKEFADKVTAKLFAIFGKTICSDLDTEDITDIIDELLKEYEK